MVPGGGRLLLLLLSLLLYSDSINIKLALPLYRKLMFNDSIIATSTHMTSNKKYK